MQTLAVVPIVINAGAAVFPMIVAAIAGIAATVFHPKAFLQLVRRGPWLTALAAGGLVVAVVFGPRLWRAAAPSRAAARPARQIDWTKVAIALIAQAPLHRPAAVPDTSTVTPAVAGSVTSATERVGTPAPQGQDFSRSLAGDDVSPAGLSPLWSFQPEGTVFLGTPAVLGKRIYVAASQVDLGGYTGLFACLDVDTGKPIWQVTEAGKDTLQAFFSSPAVTADGRYVIVGQGLHQDRDCSLLCFETATGKLHWAVKTPLHIESSPAIFGDLTVVGAGAIEGNTGQPIGDPGYVFAVRISDGQSLWKQAVNDPESSPAIDEAGIVYIGSGFNGSAVVALRSGTDEALRTQELDRVVWRTALAQPITAPVTLLGEFVIVGGGNSDMVHSDKNAQGLVVALSRRTGAIIWQTKFEDAVLGGIAARDGMLLCPLRTGEVAALAAADGQILWRTHVSGNSPVLAGGAFTKERAYVVSNDGYLAVLATATGKVLEKIYLNDQGKPGTGLSLSSPQVVGNRIIVGSETGGLRALQGKEGAK